jgi:DNA mismatch endonuclease, patch repair protein
MADTLTPDQRSKIMARVRGRDTGPERRVRSLVHRFGFRFSIWREDLPGCPDVVFSGRKKIIFVHGCFWHRHQGCSRTTLRATNRYFGKQSSAGQFFAMPLL